MPTADLIIATKKLIDFISDPMNDIRVGYESETQLGDLFFYDVEKTTAQFNALVKEVKAALNATLYKNHY